MSDELDHGRHAAQAPSGPEAQAGSGGAPAGHEAHAGRGPAPSGLSERVQKLIEHLQEMRVLQAVLRREYNREMAEQRAHDAHAQHLMETDPKGHTEAMRPLQERAHAFGVSLGIRL